MGKKIRTCLWRIVRFVFLGFMTLISVGPLVWIIMSSFKSNKEILSSAFALPTTLSFDGYKAALELAFVHGHDHHTGSGRVIIYSGGRGGGGAD